MLVTNSILNATSMRTEMQTTSKKISNELTSTQAVSTGVAASNFVQMPMQNDQIFKGLAILTFILVVILIIVVFVLFFWLVLLNMV